VTFRKFFYLFSAASRVRIRCQHWITYRLSDGVSQQHKLNSSLLKHMPVFIS